ncbi:MAG TPA: hypothetical protein VGM90_39410 [Kofleriaceae bacterium]
MKRLLCLLVASACGSTAPEPAPPVAPEPIAVAPKKPEKKREPLEQEHAKPLLSIDWEHVPLATDADANAVWKQIAPTGEDWQLKLDEVPVAQGRALGIALLHGGNFACTKPAATTQCAALVLDVEDPTSAATMDDPCLRRMLAMWSIGQLEDADVPGVMDSLRAIVQIPPPESQLVAAAIDAIPEADLDHRLELIALAYKAGQKDVANAQLGVLDDGHLVSAATKFHIDGALEILSANGYRAVFLAAVVDEQLPGKVRADAIGELMAEDDKLQNDAKMALVKAAKSQDCQAAAAAARALASRGDKRFIPSPARGSSPQAALHQVCVLAAYERMLGPDEASIAPTFVPPKGLEQSVVAYDPYSDTDADGDGDPHTSRKTELIPRAEVTLPEVDDMVRSFRSCSGTICASADRDFQFTFKAVNGALLLSRIDLVDRLPCPVSR